MAMTLRISEDEAKRLRDRANAEGTSMQDVALTAIRAYLDGKTRADLVSAALDDTMIRYESTIKRLGE
ncbi:MAG: hypothetical protein ABIR57_01385 [Aeromicrobium sp.]